MSFGFLFSIFDARSISCISAAICDFYYIFTLLFSLTFLQRFLADQQKFFYESCDICVVLSKRKSTLTSEKLRIKDKKHKNTHIRLMRKRGFRQPLSVSFVETSKRLLFYPIFFYCKKFLDSSGFWIFLYGHFFPKYFWTEKKDKQMFFVSNVE